MKTVTCEITRSEMIDMKPPVPSPVQIRQKLNNRGFKFEDDGKLSSIVNLDPKPLGEFVCWEDYKTGSIHYKQILNHQCN